ncbi:MFS transporter [Alkalibacter saccharofermentans]|uniref:Sugar phosphate permease n=1 Tax=Alkalibacter saccharofermentans DSM 14828 TaxID=1120975 RepID=A0A1M4UX89_9FIRM|nr:MFS transporter [Alkalibacter saccharofermentans]SHE61243.1 Sugar phosphate permease [Alkalibacter saccharofermentans DSM 14828]
MNNNNFRRYFQFFLIVLAAGAIYPVIYLRTNYQVTILEVFNLTQPQLNNFYSMLGIAYVIGYIPSGLIADRFSAKKLIGVSLLGTALCGFWFAQVPGYTSVNIIFFLWGIFSVFTFWSAHMKIVKMLSRSNEEGRFFGILDGGRGIVEAVMASVGLAIFASILGTSDFIQDKQSALVAVIYLYSVIVFATGVLILIFVDDDKKLASMSENNGESSEDEKFHLRDVGKLLKNKYIYLMGGIIFMGYSVFWTVYYIGGFLQTNIGIDAVSVGTITVVILWMRPVGGFIGGFLADRIGRTKTIRIALIGAACFLAISALLPVSMAGLFQIIVVGLGVFLYMIRGTYWSLLGMSKIEAAMMGTAIGVISFIGYLPDIILPQLNSFLWATFGDQGGYNAYFIVSAALGLIGVGILSVYSHLNSKEKAIAEKLETAKDM